MNCSPEKPFMSLSDACKVTGMSVYFLRRSCKDGSCPHIKSGAKYMVNVPALLEKLDEESREAKGTAS